ncbi:Glycerophosphocholine phosphodiesterase GPCPD1 [Aphelenchoides bicaudatus]|nr:Glycerophosphocholine phosphodiesterase GPCPD1 [Aphelenchoides bicaudatus]
MISHCASTVSNQSATNNLPRPRVTTPPPSGPITVHFVVHCNTIGLHELVFLTGNLEQLGNWKPDEAIELMRDEENESTWRTKIELPSEETREMLKFRYFIGFYLQANNDSPKIRIISKWEAQRAARTILPSVEADSTNTCRLKHVDEFGCYGGREIISDGWLNHDGQTEILLRLHSDALKFFKPRHIARKYYIKVTPFDLRHKEASCTTLKINDYAPYSKKEGVKSLWRLASFYVSSVDDEESEQPVPPPLLPSFSPTDLAIISNGNPHFHDQQPLGSLFQNGQDYFIFRTQTVAIEFLSFRIEFFCEKKSNSTTTSLSSDPLSNGSIDSSGTNDNGTLSDSKDSTKTEAKKLVTFDVNTKQEVVQDDLPKIQPKLERVAMSHVMPTSMPDTLGQMLVPILSKTNQIPIGQLTIDYLSTKTLSEQPSVQLTMETSFSRYWRKRKTVEVGHRGYGASYTKFSAIRENTLHSFNSAAKNGADFVEFDVQLTKDMIPIIFHDFHVLIRVAKRVDPDQLSDHSNANYLDPEGAIKNGKSPSGEPVEPIFAKQHNLVADFHEIAIKDLRLEQLHLLHVEHYQALEHSDKLPLISNEPDEFHQPFPTLVNGLKHVHPEVGFNIEVKYPMLLKDGSHECDNYSMERNKFIDLILKDVIENANGRRILFSSFEPDVCYAIARKQNLFPVLFLCVGNTRRYVPFLDARSSFSIMAVNFATTSNMLGVNFHSEELLQDREPIELAKKFNLVSFVWGDDLDLPEHVEYFKNELNVDGIIYDKIGEVEKRQNCFVLEKEVKSILFSPAASLPPSRRSSVGDDSQGGLPTVATLPLLNPGQKYLTKEELGSTEALLLADIRPRSPCLINNQLTSNSSSSSLQKTPPRSPQPCRWIGAQRRHCVDLNISYIGVVLN